MPKAFEDAVSESSIAAYAVLAGKAFPKQDVANALPMLSHDDDNAYDASDDENEGVPQLEYIKSGNASPASLPPPPHSGGGAWAAGGTAGSGSSSPASPKQEEGGRFPQVTYDRQSGYNEPESPDASPDGFPHGSPPASPPAVAAPPLPHYHNANRFRRRASSSSTAAGATAAAFQSRHPMQSPSFHRRGHATPELPAAPAAAAAAAAPPLPDTKTAAAKDRQQKREETERMDKLMVLHRLEREFPSDFRANRWSQQTSLVELRYELDTRLRNKQEDAKVRYLFTFLHVFTGLVEHANQRFGPFLQLKGWSAEVKRNHKEFEEPMRELAVQLMGRGPSNPIANLATLLAASAFMFHVDSHARIAVEQHRRYGSSNNTRAAATGAGLAPPPQFSVPPPPPAAANRQAASQVLSSFMS